MSENGISELQQQPNVTASQNRTTRFVVGVVAGIIVGGSLVGLLSGSVAPSWLENLILSSMTWLAFSFIMFGYFYKKGGQKTLLTDILLGVGIGITLVWFVGAGNGTLTLSDITF